MTEFTVMHNSDTKKLWLSTTINARCHGTEVTQPHFSRQLQSPRQSQNEITAAPIRIECTPSSAFQEDLTALSEAPPQTANVPLNPVTGISPDVRLQQDELAPGASSPSYYQRGPHRKHQNLGDALCGKQQAAVAAAAAAGRHRHGNLRLEVGRMLESDRQQ